MTAVFWRVLIFALLGALIFFGARRIWRDWTGHARKLEKAERDRDLRERKRSDVITLQRDKDGKYRPPGKGDDAA